MGPRASPPARNESRWGPAGRREDRRPPAVVGAGATLYGRAGIGEAMAWPLEPPRQGPVAQWLEPAAHNGLVGGSSPPGPTILLRATRFAGFASFLIAKQDALRSLGGGGLSECATSICCKANRLWSTLCRHHVRPEAAACTMPESLRIRPNTFPGNW